MKIPVIKINSRVFCISICISVFLCHSTAQQNIGALALPDYHKSNVLTPFFNKDETVGSTYLSSNWLRGTAELSSHKRIPEPDQPLLFNFDKIHNILYTVNREDKIWFYPSDSILSFNLVEDNTVYSFEKVSWISDNFFLTPLIKSEKGFSLYKRLFTKFIQADFSSEGYYTKGRNFDEYVDYYEYYIIYPGNNGQFRKLYLKKKDIRKALKEESKLMDDFFSIYDNEITEQSLIGIIQFINDKKFPD
jgi:hypothetical protein